MYIQKRNGLESLDRWKAKFKVQRKRNARYADFYSDENSKQQIKQSLIGEQKGLCCYCCCGVNDDNSHIEHFMPQSLFQSMDLEYRNLLISCNGANGKMKNCGHTKKSIIPTDVLISPLELSCESNFYYTGRGNIRPCGDAKRAQQTIDILKLDSPALSSAREAALWASGVFSGDEDLDEIRELIYNPVDGIMLPFSNIIAFFLSPT